MFGLPNSLPAALPHLANARDIADAAPGIVRGVYIRSDAPREGDASPGGLEWPPLTVFDLRDDSEIKGSHPFATSADVRRVRILAEASVSGLMAGADTTLELLYASMIDETQAPGFAEVVRGIANAPAPVLTHCSAGKDRAGVTAALVLSLLGVPRECIVADYVATKRNMPAVMARLLKDYPPQMRLAAQAGLGGLGGEAPVAPADAGGAEAWGADGVSNNAGRDANTEPPMTSGGGIKLPGFMADIMARVTAMLDAPPEAIESVLDVWDAHPGGVEGWYLDHGGDRETLAALRARLLEGAA